MGGIFLGHAELLSIPVTRFDVAHRPITSLALPRVRVPKQLVERVSGGKTDH